MGINLIDKVLDVTENPEQLIRIFLPHLRGVSYFANRLITDDEQFDIDSIKELTEQMSNCDLLNLSCKIDRLNSFLISTSLINIDDSIINVIKTYIANIDNISYISHLINKTLHGITVKLFGIEFRDDSLGSQIEDIRDALKITLNITDNSRHAKLVERFQLIAYFSLSTCLLYSLARKTKSSINNLDILKLSIIFLYARMEYEIRGLHKKRWLPMIVNTLAQHGGRFFRLCNINCNGECKPIYSVMFNSLKMHHADMPDWHDNLYKEVERQESASNHGLNKLFMFYISDIFVKYVMNNNNTYLNAINLNKPFPTIATLNRFWNLYLLPNLYDPEIDVDLWWPPQMIKRYICTNTMSYADKELALRKEYFPEYVFDINALVHFATEYYHEKVQLDMEYGNITDTTALDDISIWYLSDWLKGERQYEFLENLCVKEIAEMIAKNIKKYKQI